MNRLTLIFILSVFFIPKGFSQVSMKKSDHGFLIVEGDRKIAFYQKEETFEGKKNGRLNYLHPVYLPNGEILTEDAPADHLHHRGIFWAWHQLMVDGKSVGDSWDLRDFIQEVKSVNYRRLKGGAGQLSVQVLWKSPLHMNGEEAFLEEQTEITFYKLKKKQQIIAFEIKLNPLVENFEIGGSDDHKGYGGFSVRMKLPDDIAFESRNGSVEPIVAALEEGSFMDIHGSLGEDGKKSGVLVIADPEIQTSKQSWILRKQGSMQNAVFPGRTPVRIEKEKPIVLKYAIVLYNGKINSEKVNKEVQLLID